MKLGVNSMKLKFSSTTLVSVVTGLITTLAESKAADISDVREANRRADNTTNDLYKLRSEKDNEIYKLKSEMRELTYSRDNYKSDAEYADQRVQALEEELGKLRADLSKVRADNVALRQAAGESMGSVLGFTEAEYNNIVDLLKNPWGNKITAIKLVREKTGFGLKDAKDLVEDGKTFVEGGFNKTATNAINPPSMGGPIAPVMSQSGCA